MSQTYLLTKGHGLRESIKANALSFIARLPETKSWRIEIKEARKERTSDQNAALFGVAYKALTEATGYTADELHNEFCGRYFGWEVYEIFGERRRRPVRTTTTKARGERELLSTRDMADFYAFVQRVGAEAGIDVPDPDPMHGRIAA